MDILFIINPRMISEYKTVIFFAFIIIGIIQCFYGYRFFKAIMAIIGFIIGLGIGAFLGGIIGKGDPISVIVGAIIGGIVFSKLVVMFYYLSVFVIGFVGGALLGMLFITLFNSDVNPAVLIIFGILGGIIALYLQKFIIIVSTSFNGAYFIVSAIFLLFMDPYHFSALYNLEDSAQNMFLYAVSIIVLWLIGILVQYGKFEALFNNQGKEFSWNQLKLNDDDIKGDSEELKRKFG